MNETWARDQSPHPLPSILLLRVRCALHLACIYVTFVKYSINQYLYKSFVLRFLTKCLEAPFIHLLQYLAPSV